MSTLKTQKNAKSVNSFLENVADEKKRKDCLFLLDMMKKATGDEPSMWGESIVGFGHFRYRYASGRENDWFLCGFSPRKKQISIYFMTGFDKLSNYLNKLGKHKTGKGCLYIQELEDIDTRVLAEMLTHSVKLLRRL